MASKEEVCKAAEKLVETLDVDASVLRMPAHVALAIVNLQNAVKAQKDLEQKLADKLARECDRLLAELEQVKRERNFVAATDDAFWLWSDTDPNELSSLVDGALVKMTAGQLRKILSYKGPRCKYCNGPVDEAGQVHAGGCGGVG